MSSRFESLVDKTVHLAQDLLGDIVGGTLAKARRALAKHAAALAIGMAGLVLALVFGAIAAHAWLKTVTTAAWAPPLIVAGACGLAGLLGLRALSGGG